MSVTGRLELAARRLAAAPRLLVASDFDGTLAPLVPLPEDARMVAGAGEALVRLAACPRTCAAIVTGRDVASLRAVCPPMPGVMLIGGYGSQWPGKPEHARPDEREVLDRLARRFRGIVGSIPGAFVEQKAVSVALNVRLASPASAAEAMALAGSIAAEIPGLTRHAGAGVVEFSTRPGRKGDAVERLKDEHGASIAAVLGDDEPDVEMFGRLGDDDVKLLVESSGATAPWPGVLAVPSPIHAAAWLCVLAELRERATDPQT